MGFAEQCRNKIHGENQKMFDSDLQTLAKIKYNLSL